MRVLLVAAASYPLTAATTGDPYRYADYLRHDQGSDSCSMPKPPGGWVCFYPMDGDAPFADDPPG